MTKGNRELQLDRRDRFFSDPAFRDILTAADDDKNLHNKLDVFRQRSGELVGLGGTGLDEAAHNLQVWVLDYGVSYT